MSTPFRYGTTRHHRTESPRAYRDYRSYKPYLRREFRATCVYCRLPDGLKGMDAFGVDHYMPKEEFPHLTAEYENLFYACNACNARKGSFWLTINERKEGYFIPNPCDHVMYDHLRYRQVKVVPHSTAGECAVEVIQLNDVRSIEYRELVVRLIGCALREKEVIEARIAHYRQRLPSVTEQAQQLRLHQKLNAQERLLEGLGSTLLALTGPN